MFALGKTRQGLLQVLEFMGITLDTLKMEARLPADKIHHIRTIFSEFEAKKSCTLKELQSLIGTLNFACKVVPPGRPFLQRMIDLTRNVKESHHHIKLNLGFFKDLAMWKQFITNRQLACYQSIMGKMVTFTCARNGRRGASILHVRNIVYF